MTASPSVPQRLGRFLERVTHQSGRLSTTPAYGSLLLGAPDESPAKRRLRIQAILAVLLLTVNAIGVLVATVLVTVAYPVPSVFNDVPKWLPFLAVPSLVVVAMVLGTLWIHGRTVRELRWAIDNREPTVADQRTAFLIPWRIALANLTIWSVGTAVLAYLYGKHDERFVVMLVPTLGFCGLLVATSAYLAAEFALRPVAALALAAGPPPRRLAPGIMGRTMTVWMLGSGVPVIGIGLTALFALLLGSLDRQQLAVAVVITSVITLLFGFVLMWILAWLTATPVRVVRSALRRVEEGDLDANLVPFDGTELGELQRGFNSMVDGLRERERVRDLFSRHVGREVAAAAEHGESPTLGGEERHVAALFIDIVGSTKLVSTLPPIQVVELLNRFFAVIVEEVDRNNGLVNKFEGDAALAVFGAPTALESPEDAALSAARAILARLEREVPECPARIGVAAGQVVAGNVGARERFEYTVIGAPVNEAARLSELARAEPGRVLATETTIESASATERGFWRLGKSVKLRGYDDRVRIAGLAHVHR